MPLCFVLMPFGTKKGADGATIQFDTVYQKVIAPAIEDAGLTPFRADEEQTGGIVHKPMFERLLLNPYAVADLTQFNPNVLYELGVRHAARPHSTVHVSAKTAGLRYPFDVQNLRILPYRVNVEGLPSQPGKDRAALRDFLAKAQERVTDSPIYQLLNGVQPVQVPHEKTEIFQRQFEEAAGRKAEFAGASTLEELRACEGRLGSLEDDDAGVLVSLMLAYRDRKGWSEMVSLAKKMPAHLSQTILVREQYALALNRLGKRGEAEAVLLRLLRDRGDSSETLGILGRVYKDWWQDAQRAGRKAEAKANLGKAVETYLRGFEADWRDAYPGVNAVTLMSIQEPDDERIGKLLPVVRYSVERKLAQARGSQADYWDYASLLELDVIGRARHAARQHLTMALGTRPRSWMTETTAHNLGMIVEARRLRKESVRWAEALENELRSYERE